MNTTERYNEQIYQLPAETILAGRYMIQSIIGQGGFGITYCGMDLKLEMKVAIKEFYPSGMVSRVSSYSERITVHEGQEQEFDWCKKRFLEEAKSLAMFADEPNAVSVRDYFEENGTVYIVMEFIEGETIANWLKDMGPISFSEVWELFRPVAVLLSHMHRKGLLHRDISPDNLMRVKNGTIKLLDFGAARHVEELQSGRTMSVIVKQGYAPVEQYMTHADQSPATDVYAFCATIYRMITGNVPNPAIERLNEDLLPKPSACGAQITRMQEAVLLHGMAVQQVERISSMEELIRAFDAVTEPQEEFEPRTGGDPDTKKTRKEKKPGSKKAQSREKGKPAKGGKASSGKKKLFLIPVVLILVAVYMFAIKPMIFKNPYYFMAGSSRIKGEVVTTRMIRQITADRNTDMLLLNECQISDAVIEKIGQMKRIKSLVIDNCNGFTTLDPLANMKKLSILRVRGNPDEKNPTLIDGDTMFGAEMPQVNSLELAYLGLTGDSSFLSHFPNIGVLETNYLTPLDDLSAIGEMPNLYLCSICNSEVADDLEGPISNEHLTLLRLENCGITTVPSVNALGRLSTLDLSGNKLESLTETLSDYNNSGFEELDVAHNQLTDLNGLETCLNLKKLYAEGNRISDLNGLENCTQLVNVYLTDNQIKDLSILAKSAGHLTSLVISGNQVSDLAPLQGMRQLMNLIANDNRIEDLTPIASNTTLQMLSFDRNQIKDISAITDLEKLRVFAACGNEISDLSPIVGKPHIAVIDLGSNQITDVTPMKELRTDSEYSAVMLENNQVTEVPTLPQSRYYVLSLFGNPITDFSAISKVDIDNCLISWSQEDEPDVIGKGNYSVDLTLVDWPMDQRAEFEKKLDAQRNYYYEVNYSTLKEANEIVNKKRESLYAEDNIRDGLEVSKWLNWLYS